MGERIAAHLVGQDTLLEYLLQFLFAGQPEPVP